MILLQKQFKFKFSVPASFIKDGGEVLFNTQEIGRKTLADEVQIEFAPSPKMSSYLLAFAIGKFKLSQTELKRGVKPPSPKSLQDPSIEYNPKTLIRVYAAAERTADLSFALEVARSSLEHLEDFFGCQFPLAKCDLVAVPDFEVGGMENWGLIFLREDLVFCNSESPIFDKLAVAQTIVHELAHQWFGNLVTMQWWDELWLNEGFAEFMSYLILDKMFPDWKVWELYYVIDRDMVIRIDSIMNSRPIVPQNVNVLDNLEDNFDEVAYPKSCGLVLMIYEMIGEDPFRLGLQDYFKKFAYKNTRSADLAAAWSKRAGLNLKGFLDSWIDQAGIPKITAKYNPKSQTLSLSQSRFLVEGCTNLTLTPKLEVSDKFGKKQKLFHHNQQQRLDRNSKSKLQSSLSLSSVCDFGSESLWQVPISIIGRVEDGSKGAGKSARQAERRVILKKRSLQIQLPKNFKPLKLNASGRGLYVVDYGQGFLDQDFLSLMQGGQQKNRLSEMDSLNFFSDLINLNKSCTATVKSAQILSLIMASKAETNPRFWGLVGSYLSFINKLLEERLGEGFLKSYAKELCAGVLTRASETLSKTELSLMQSEIWSILVMAGDETTTDQLGDLLRGKLNEAESFFELDAEIRGLSLVSLAKNGGASEFETMLKLYSQNLDDLELRESLSAALPFFEQQEFTERLLKIIQDQQLVRSQDLVDWVAGLVNNMPNRQLVYDWLRGGGIDWLNQELGSQGIPGLTASIFSSAVSTEDLMTVAIIFDELKDLDEYKKSHLENLELAKSRLAWVEKESEEIQSYLLAIK